MIQDLPSDIFTHVHAILDNSEKVVYVPIGGDGEQNATIFTKPYLSLIKMSCRKFATMPPYNQKSRL